MEEKITQKPFDLYLMGHWIRYLAESMAGGPYWKNVKVTLEKLTQFKEIGNLSFVGVESEQIKNLLSNKYWKDDQVIEFQDRIQLQSELSKWEGRIQEILKHWTLSFCQAHLDVSKLTSGAKSFLKDEEWNVLQPLEQQGLNEAASCLLYNNFTSAEFIALRAVESVLRRWYEKKTSKKLEKQMWGEILDELNELYPKKSQRPKELSLLDYLRERRNEIAHPEAISNPEAATATFLNIIAVCKEVKSFLLP